MSNLTKRQQYWRKHLDQLSTSGLSTKAYAEKHDLNLSTLYLNRRKLRDSDPLQAASTQFVRASVSSRSLPCRAHLRNGIVVELGVDSESLAKVLNQLASLS